MKFQASMLLLCVFLGACASGGKETAKYQSPAPQSVDPTVESHIQQRFGNSVMMAIARCESGMRQFEANGSTPLRGRVHRPDTGVFQINKSAHAKKAERLGLNLDTLEGNVAYASHLYETEGTTPWVSSRHCWRGKFAQRS